MFRRDAQAPGQGAGRPEGVGHAPGAGAGVGAAGVHDDAARGAAFGERAIETLRALPGVVAVSPASRLPLSPDINMDGMRVQGFHSADEQETPVDSVAVGPDYFTAVGVPIVAGRAFTPDDVAQRRRVAMNANAQARLFKP